MFAPTDARCTFECCNSTCVSGVPVYESVLGCEPVKRQAAAQQRVYHLYLLSLVQESLSGCLCHNLGAAALLDVQLTLCNCLHWFLPRVPWLGVGDGDGGDCVCFFSNSSCQGPRECITRPENQILCGVKLV
jgi:hypothetical protein